MEGNGDGARKRRRTGWDAPTSAPVLPPAALPTPALPSTAAATAAAMQAQILLAQQQALAQTLAAKQAAAAVHPALAMGGLLVPQQQQAFVAPVLPPAPVPAPVASSSGPQRIECRLYVGSLHYSVTEADVRAIFGGFGTVTRIDMSYEPSTGRSKGYCFVEFADQVSVYAALDMNGADIAGRKIKVGRPSGVPGAPSAAQLIADATATMLAAGSALPAPGPADGSNGNGNGSSGGGKSSSGAGGGGGKAPKSRFVCVRNVRREVDAGELQSIFAVFGTVKRCTFYGDDVTLLNPAPLASVATGAVPMFSPTLVVRNAVVEYASPAHAADSARQMNGFLLAGQVLLVDLVDEATAHRIVPKDAAPDAAGASSSSSSSSSSAANGGMEGKSRVVFLENVVSVEEAADPQLRREMGEEAEKYGPLEDVAIYIDPRRIVVVVLTYVLPDGASAAYRAMNGRFFGGRKIAARLGP